MGQQSMTIEEFNEQLQQWKGKPIKITKKELDDIDEIFLQLDSVSYTNNPNRLDDYIPKHSLQLNGEGEIKNNENERAPLPAPVYEIVLDDNGEYTYDGTAFSLRTERAAYKIETQ